jgi:hypothetical protein
MIKTNIRKNKKRRALGLAIKKIAIEYKGSNCKSCDKIFHPKTFCFHHVDESIKSFEIKDFITKYRARPNMFIDFGYKLLISELDKCILLCHNCHSDIHAMDIHDNEVEEMSKVVINNNDIRKLFGLKPKRRKKIKSIIIGGKK